MAESPSSKVYHVGDLLKVTFTKSEVEREQVLLETKGLPTIYFSFGDFEEFLSTINCFENHWPEQNIMIGQYNIAFGNYSKGRGLAFLDDDDSILFCWVERYLSLFIQHYYELFKINTEMFGNMYNK